MKLFNEELCIRTRVLTVNNIRKLAGYPPLTREEVIARDLGKPVMNCGEWDEPEYDCDNCGTGIDQPGLCPECETESICARFAIPVLLIAALIILPGCGGGSSSGSKGEPATSAPIPALMGFETLSYSVQTIGSALESSPIDVSDSVDPISTIVPVTINLDTQEMEVELTDDHNLVGSYVKHEIYQSSRFVLDSSPVMNNNGTIVFMEMDGAHGLVFIP